MRKFCNNDHSVIYDSLAKSNRYLSTITYAEESDRDDIKELISMAEDVLNSLDVIEIFKEDE